VYEGKPVRESMPMVYWADTTFAGRNPLVLAGDDGEAKTQAAVAKFSSGEFNVWGAVYEALTAPTDEAREAPKEKLFRACRELAKDVKSSGGPFLLGSQFTAADIAVYPMVERALILLPYYHKINIPQGDEYEAFYAWVKAVAARPSVAITSADRTQRSIETQPFAAVSRNEFLIEMMEGIVNGVKEQVRRQLRFAPAGVRTANIAAAIETKKKEQEAREHIIAGEGTASELLAAYFETYYASGAEGDRFATLLDESARLERPYGVGLGQPTVVEGKANLVAHAASFRSRLADFRFHTIDIRTISSTEAVATAAGLGRAAVNGREYRQPAYAFFAHSKNGKLTKVTEFFDPVQVALTFDIPIKSSAL
jgi:glutathione S-transferase/ketosteroid isomerase-like protein